MVYVRAFVFTSLESWVRKFYSSPIVIRVIKSRMGWAGHTARMVEIRNFGPKNWREETT